jgi:hypothetical protein
MFDNSSRTDDEDKPGIEERYTVATNTSNLRLDVREGSPQRSADIIIAAGWNQSRIGGALLRLHTEFDGIERRRKAATKDDFLPIGPSNRDQRKAAARLARQANDEAMGKQLEGLRSLPDVFQQMTLQLVKWRVQDAEAKAIDVLLWWLAQACPECGGTKFKVAEGTGRHTGKVCQACLGTGKREMPHARTHLQEDKRLANFMDQCVERARAAIGRRLHR